MRIDLKKAEQIILDGGILAIPTETVYGLAADAFNPEAIRSSFYQKGRPADNPLIVHISDLRQLDTLIVNPPPELSKLANHFWPGPLSLVCQKHPSVPDVATGGLDTVAVRMPDHPLTLELISGCGPLTAPSANKSGRPSPTKAQHVEDDFGKNFPVLDGGECGIGLESTVLDLTNDPFTILRPGAVSKQDLEELLGNEINSLIHSANKEKPASPGIKYTHYKPDADVSWIEKPPVHPHSNTLYLIHSLQNVDQNKAQSHLNVISFSGDFKKMAKQLYDLFRYADHQNYTQIAIEKMPGPSTDELIQPLINRISKAIQS